MKTLRPWTKRLVLGGLLAAAACGAPLVVPDAASTPVVTPASTPTVSRPRLVTPTLPPTPTESAAAVATRAALPPVGLEDSLPLVVWQPEENRNVLVPVHPLTGEPLAAYAPIPLGHGYSAAYAPAGETVALAAFASDNPSLGGEIVLVDLRAWEAQATGIKVDDYPALFQFAPDGASLLIVEGRLSGAVVRRVTPADGQEAARVELDFLPRSLSVTPDGREVLVYGGQGQSGSGLNPTAWAARLDYATLAVEWSQTLEGVRDGQFVPEGTSLEAAHDEALWYGPAYAWAADATKLFLVHADADRLTTVDFAAEAVRTVAIAPAQSWLDRLMALTAGVAEAKMLNGTMKQAVLSPDGARLYVVGYQTEFSDYGFKETPLGLTVIETATGTLLAHTDTAARNVSLTPTGNLLLEVWGEESYAEMRQANDLSVVVTTLSDIYLQHGRLLNGETVLFGLQDQPNHTRFQALDPETFALLGQWATDGYGYPLLAP